MLLTSLGPVVLHGGSEFMRSKAASPLVEYVKHTESGPVYIHGKRDTYNLRRPNLFLWETLGRNTEDGAACNFQRMNEYWRGLIALRRSEYGRVLRHGDPVAADYIRWIEPDDAMLLGYVIGERVAVAVNTGDMPASLSLILSDGEWVLVAAGDRAGTEPLTGLAQSVLHGGIHPVSLEARDVRIWVRK